MTQHDIPELDAQGLRKFAFVTGTIFVLLFALVLPWIFGFSFPLWPWIIAAVLLIWGAIAPATLNPVYRVWMRFGLIMNRITTPIILGVVFFLLITPVALMMRLFGRDTMASTTDNKLDTYRIPSKVREIKNIERPF